MKNKFLPKLGDNKMTWSITHKMTLSIADILVRFSDSTGITDLRELRDFIANLSPEEFAKFKFKDSAASVVDAEFVSLDGDSHAIFENQL